jgi:molybdenum cofactor cytidylyltransferase
VKPAIVGIIVAAGASSRMGEHKPLLLIAGRPMLQWVIDAAEASKLDRVVVVTGPTDAEIRSTVETERADFVRNETPEHGTMSSLRVGVTAAGPVDAVVKLVADQPEVISDDIDALITGWDPDRYTAGLLEYSDGRGHPLLVTTTLLEEVIHQDGDRLLWHLIEHQAKVLVVPIDRPRPVDVNTPTDAARATARLG